MNILRFIGKALSRSTESDEIGENPEQNAVSPSTNICGRGIKSDISYIFCTYFLKTSSKSLRNGTSKGPLKRSYQGLSKFMKLKEIH